MTEREIFIAARQLQDPAAREAFLDQACAGDLELRRRVVALLEEQAQLGSFLEHTQRPAPTVDEPPPEQPDTLIGPYKLLQQIGEGGMGTVWMAQQTQPVKRLVALKLIKAGMDSKQVIARFETERQALALMEHVNIARVLDAGTTSTGRPYFVMELVKGAPITRYCDEHRLTPRQRLELFIPVCQAVQHAHQKGVIHRDLKPSNVLVALYDGKPVPKVIDFGVAKAAGQSLTDKTLVTGLGNIVGTLEYMSPEQAEVNQLDIDTRSDIYSLGVLLYELLTGGPPFTRKDLEKVGMLEMLRVIRESEPSKPSTKLSSAERLPTLAANRGTEPAKLTKLVRGELDWIVMKALEKDRNRRYETANGFAMDVQRYLADEPVLAGPPSAWYRLRKFARRNKSGLAVAALLLSFVVLLGGGSGWVIRDQAARRAQAASDTEAALRESHALQDQQKWTEALVAARHAQVLTGDGNDTLHRRLRERIADLEMAVELDNVRLRRADYTEFGFDHERASAEYAEAFRQYGIDVAARQPRDASAFLQTRSIRVELAMALDDWALLLRFQDNKAWRDRIAVARTLDPDPFRDRVRSVVAGGDGKDLEEWARTDQITDLPAPTLVLLARTLDRQEKLERTEALLRKAQRKRPGDFWINYELGLFLSQVLPTPATDAMRFHEAAVALRPDNPWVHTHLGNALHQSGRPDEGIAEFQEAIRLQKDYAVAHNNLCNALYESGRFGEAIAEGREAIRLRRDYAEAHNNLGIALKGSGKLDEAIVELREAIRLKKNYAQAHHNLGNALAEKGRRKEALVEIRAALSIKKDYASAHSNLGRILKDEGQTEEAIKECREGIRLKPDDAKAHDALGLALEAANRLQEAIDAYREAIRLKPDSWAAHGNLGTALRKLGRLDEAFAEFKESARLAPPNRAEPRLNLGVGFVDKGLLDDGIREFREATRVKKDHFGAHWLLGKALATKGQFDEAISCYEEALQLAPHNANVLNDFAWLLATCPDPKFRDPARAVQLAGRAVEHQPRYRNAWNTLGIGNYRTGDSKAAIEALNRSMSLKRDGDAYDWFFLAMSKWKLGDKEDAIKWFNRAVTWMEKGKQKHEDLERFRAEAAQLLELKK
jgi:tetratricopeptide (TPR) repeat protein